jgi:phosphatidylglycerophosphate synthase
VHPTWLTAASLLVGVAAATAGWLSAFGAGLGLWVLNRVLDGLDGIVARLGGRVTDLGGFLDLVSDFVVYASVPVALALRPGAPPELRADALLLLAVFYVNTAAWMIPSAILEKRGQGAARRGEPTSVSIPEGIVSGGETVVFYSLFFLFPAWQSGLFRLMAVLTALTVVQRVVWAARHFRGAPNAGV